MAAKVLIVEDTESLSVLYQNYLIITGVDTQLAATAAEAKQHLEAQSFDLVLLDIMLPDASGIDVLEWINSHQEKPQVIMMTAHGTKELVTQSMRLGAIDFVEKPIEADRLRVTVNNALKMTRLEKRVKAQTTEQSEAGFCNMVGRSGAMKTVYEIIRNASKSKASVFITGESGTGKELCAEAIHQCSDRTKGQFVALNCAAIPKDLIESEIFGHVKGAFTGASTHREGAAGLAHKGTLFFDEICEMDLNLQSKLLRFIQTGTYQKVGGEKLEHVDVRFVCATNRDPWEEVQKGNFREDLYYRLHVVPIHLPPLRDRESDVIDIANVLFKRISEEEGKSYEGLSLSAESLIQNFSWPGNVRELENTIRNVVVLNSGGTISGEMFPLLRERSGDSQPQMPQNVANTPETIDSQNNPLVSAASLMDATQASPSPRVFFEKSTATSIVPMWQIEKQYIEAAIEACSGNISKAAAALEINPSTIYRKMKDWGSA